MTREEREARDVMRRWLSGETTTVQAAYKQLLEERNPLIVKDAMDRLAGKVKEQMEVTGEDGAPLVPQLTEETLTEVIKLFKERKK